MLTASLPVCPVPRPAAASLAPAQQLNLESYLSPPPQDTLDQSWLQTQGTHAQGTRELTAAFPVHYESWVGGHLTADKVRGGAAWDNFISQQFVDIGPAAAPVPSWLSPGYLRVPQ